MSTIRRFLTLVFSAVVVLAMTWTQPALALDVYTTPGTHHVNGRDWRTTCEPYSATTRCRTEIYATQVSQVHGKFVSRNGWYFNNLTYVASPRKLWATNPLGHTGSWTAADGRKWRTECDTPATGHNGCRSYIVASVIESYKQGGTWHYRWTSKWIFNDMVRFSAEAAPPVLPPGSVDPATIKDPHLRKCITDAISTPVTTIMTATQLASVTGVDCGSKGVETLQGMPALPNLTNLVLDDNLLTNLAGMPSLPKLAWAYFQDNSLATVKGMPALPALQLLYLDRNELTKLSGLPVLPELLALTIGDNHLKTLSGVPVLTKLQQLFIANNQVSRVAPLAGFTGLTDLDLRGNPVTDLSTLDALVAAGLKIYT